MNIHSLQLNNISVLVSFNNHDYLHMDFLYSSSYCLFPSVCSKKMNYSWNILIKNSLLQYFVKHMKQTWWDCLCNGYILLLPQDPSLPLFLSNKDVGMHQPSAISFPCSLFSNWHYLCIIHIENHLITYSSNNCFTTLNGKVIENKGSYYITKKGWKKKGRVDKICRYAYNKGELDSLFQFAHQEKRHIRLSLDQSCTITFILITHSLVCHLHSCHYWLSRTVQSTTLSPATLCLLQRWNGMLSSFSSISRLECILYASNHTHIYIKYAHDMANSIVDLYKSNRIHLYSTRFSSLFLVWNLYYPNNYWLSPNNSWLYSSFPFLHWIVRSKPNLFLRNYRILFSLICISFSFFSILDVSYHLYVHSLWLYLSPHPDCLRITNTTISEGGSLLTISFHSRLSPIRPSLLRCILSISLLTLLVDLSIIQAAVLLPS